MGAKVPVPARPPVPEGKCRICVAGFGVSHNVAQAQRLASAIAEAFPDEYETWFYFSSFGYGAYLKEFQEKDLPDEFKSKPCSKDANPKTFGTQTAAPLIFFETAGGKIEPKGGRDLFCEWAGQQEKFKDKPEIMEHASVEAPSHLKIFFDNKTPGGTYLKSTK